MVGAGLMGIITIQKTLLKPLMDGASVAETATLTKGNQMLVYEE